MSETILEGKLSSFTESLIKIVNSNVSLMKIPCKHFHQQHIHRFIRPIPHHTWSLFGLESQLANSSLASYYHSRHVIDQVFVSALCQLLLHITLSSELRNKLSRLQQHNFGSQYKWRPQLKTGSDIISPAPVSWYFPHHTWRDSDARADQSAPGITCHTCWPPPPPAQTPGSTWRRRASSQVTVSEVRPDPEPTATSTAKWAEWATTTPRHTTCRWAGGPTSQWTASPPCPPCPRCPPACPRSLTTPCPAPRGQTSTTPTIITWAAAWATGWQGAPATITWWTTTRTTRPCQCPWPRASQPRDTTEPGWVGVISWYCCSCVCASYPTHCLTIIVPLLYYFIYEPSPNSILSRLLS